MKKILVFGASGQLGGTESYLLTLYQSLDKERIQFDFLVPHNINKISYEQRIIENGGRIFREYYTNSERKKEGYLSARDIIERHIDIDGIYVNVQCIHSAYRLLVEAYRHKIRYRIWHIHNNNYARKPTLRERLYEIFFYATYKMIVTHCLACSELAGKWIYHNHPFKIIPDAIDFDKFKPNSVIRKLIRKKYCIENKYVIGFCGRISYQKNPEFLIEIFYELQKLERKTCLLIIGEGNKRKALEDMVKEKHITDKVLFIGEVPNVQDYMQAMDFFLLPSRYEGFGIVLLEAQAAGLNCMTSQDVVPKETNITGRVHFTSLNGSPEFWAKEILSIGFERKNCIEELRKSQYSIENLVKEMERIFEIKKETY